MSQAESPDDVVLCRVVVWDDVCLVYLFICIFKAIQIVMSREENIIDCFSWKGLGTMIWSKYLIISGQIQS